MADAVHIAENSPEEVALKLLEIVAYCEEKSLRAHLPGEKASRAWVLQSYAQCLSAVKQKPYTGFTVEPLRL